MTLLKTNITQPNRSVGMSVDMPMARQLVARQLVGPRYAAAGPDGTALPTLSSLSKLFKLSSLPALLTLLLSLLLSSCTDTTTPDEPTIDDKVNLVLSIYAGNTAPGRSISDTPVDPDGYQPAATQYELMRTLRVIIVRPNGKVEHNIIIDQEIDENGVAQYNDIRRKVYGGETKQIYLIANEASLPNNIFRTLTVGTEFPTKDVQDMELSCTPGTPLIDNTGADKKYLPMCESYSIDVIPVDPTKDGDTEQSAYLFVTRAAVKFGFYVYANNAPLQPYQITGITVSSLSDREYFFPNDAKYKPEKSVTSTEMSDWANRYIYSYNTPGECQKKSYTFYPTNITIDKAISETNAIAYEPEIYFPETKIDETKVSITVTNPHDPDDPLVIDLTPQALGDLPHSMPRNTFVKVYIGFNDQSMRVDVVPYTATELNPGYGFDFPNPKPPTPGVPPWAEIHPDD